MPIIKFAGKAIEVDENGHLVNSNDWSEELAEQIAKAEKLSRLTEKRWEIINFLRKHYLQYKTIPMFEHYSSALDKKHETSDDCLHNLYINFWGGIRQACKIAGLPRPSG